MRRSDKDIYDNSQSDSRSQSAYWSGSMQWNSDTAVAFGTPNTGGTTTYTWTNDDTSIGLAASGTGDIASFTATNTGTAPVVATIVVTPHFTERISNM